jgi:pilus assembly protein CpaE
MTDAPLNDALDDASTVSEAATYSLGAARAARAPKRVRDKFIGFAVDEASAMILHEAVSPLLPSAERIHVVNFRVSLTVLAGMPTPEIVLIDISGEDQPINALMELADVVEPGTTVLVIGEIQNVNFYRTVTKGMGVKEYLAKPLTAAKLSRHFLPVITNRGVNMPGQRDGRVVTFAGARGGVGVSTIVSNLAWYIANELHRHTVLLDGELHTGTAMLSLNLGATKGLSLALEMPERVDNLLIERSVQPAGERLHVLAAQEALDKPLDYQPGGAIMLTNALRKRYNFLVADAGARLSPLSRDLFFCAQQRVVVIDPSTISIRNLERLATLPGGPGQSPHTMVVLNRAGTPGGISQTYMENVLGLKFDAVIPDLPRVVPKSTQFGTPAAAVRGPFRNAIAALAAALGAHAMAEAA